MTTDSVAQILEGAVDLHVHPAPSPLPRRLDAAEAAKLAAETGFRAIVVKSHHHSTVTDVLALASVREQFGQVLVEAMACGVPPIAVDRFGPADIVRDGETGWLVEPDDREALTAAIVEAVEDEPERDRRAEAARHDARERFSWPALAGRLAEVLDGASAADPVAPARD